MPPVVLLPGKASRQSLACWRYHTNKVQITGSKVCALMALSVL
jgi:hypothetical protein